MKIGSVTYEALSKDTFLSKFGKPELYYNLNPLQAASPMKLVRSSGLTAGALNKDRDIYFIPNRGGTKERDITFITSCYVDLDAGKNASGKYLTEAKVTAAKKNMRDKIADCPIKPTYIVETRNGYQLYWLLGQIKAEFYPRAKWAIVQNKLCNFFKDAGADSKVLKLNQILRVPGFMWRKKHTGLKPFPVSAYYFKNLNRLYSLEEISVALAVVPGTKPKSTQNSFAKQYVPIAPKAQSIKKKAIKKVTTQDGWDEDWGAVAPLPALPTARVRKETLTELVDYLAAISKTLIYSGNSYLGKQATKFQNELLNILSQS